MPIACLPTRRDDSTTSTAEIARRIKQERAYRALAEEASKRGYVQTSVADILQCAGMSRRTFYELFTSREDCFLQAYDAAVARARAIVVRAYHDAGDRPLRDRVAAGLRAFLELCAAEPELARLCIVEVLAVGDRGRARRDAAIREFAAFIDHPRAEARGTAAPSLVSEAIAGGLYGILYTRIANGETEMLPTLLDEMMDAGLGQLVERGDQD